MIGFEEGEAVLSRFPVISWELHRLKPRPSLFERRIVLRLELEAYSTYLSDKVRRAWLRRGQTEDPVRNGVLWASDHLGIVIDCRLQAPSD